MGNCFASCFENKESLAESTSTRSSLSTDIKSEKLETATVNNIMKKKKLSLVTSKVWNRRKNRVAPACDNDSTTSSNKTLQGSTHFLYPVSGLLESSVKSASDIISSSSRHNSSISSPNRLEEKSSASSYDEFSSQSSYSAASNSEVSRSASIKIEPSKTQGRLIIVQPCRSLSTESYESSSENLRRRVYPITNACSSSESSLFGSLSENMEQLDDCSEEEAAQVHPYVSTKFR